MATSSEIRIATWNVNSLRARMEALGQWLRGNSPDILLLQETKCTDQNFPILEINSMGYNVQSVGQKSYNGVAILSKMPMSVEATSLPMYDEEIPDEEARYLEATISFGKAMVRVASVYVPNGGSLLQKGQRLEDSPRFRYKLSFLRRLQRRAQEVLSFENEYTIFGGDLNVALSAIDLHNPEKAAGGVGFHEDEISGLQSVIHSGLTDSFRHKYPDTVAYSWWDYRTNGWASNKGWRIDYLLSSQSVIANMADCTIHAEVRGFDKTSDHVPVEILLRIEE